MLLVCFWRLQRIFKIGACIGLVEAVQAPIQAHAVWEGTVIHSAGRTRIEGCEETGSFGRLAN